MANGVSMLARLLVMVQSCWPRLRWGHLKSWIQHLEVDGRSADE